MASEAHRVRLHMSWWLALERWAPVRSYRSGFVRGLCLFSFKKPYLTQT